MLRNLWQWHQISLQGLHENFQRQSIPPTTLQSIPLIPFPFNWTRFHLLERDDIWMVESPQVLDIRFVDIPDLFDGHFLPIQFAEENSPLGPAAQPLQVCDIFKGDLPVIWNITLNLIQTVNYLCTLIAVIPVHVLFMGIGIFFLFLWLQERGRPYAFLLFIKRYFQ